MKRLKLNFTGLRARQLAILAQKKNFTRRQFIGLTGTAALGAASQAKKLGLRLPGSFKIVGDEKRLAFLLGGEERWVIDPQRFSGSPPIFRAWCSPILRSSRRIARQQSLTLRQTRSR